MSVIILAEEDAELRDQLEQTLRRRHSVRSAGDGREALEEIRASRPHMAVLDLQLPKMSGQEVLQALKGEVPVLVIAGAAKEGAAALALGAEDYVRKPVDPEELIERVDRVLAREERPRSALARPPVEVRLRELHDPRSGRVDASKVADYLGVDLAELARALGAKYTTVHKTPASQALQERLAPIKRVLEILDQILGDPTAVRAWLNSLHEDLGLRTPIQAILEGRAGAVRGILENAVLGLPT